MADMKDNDAFAAHCKVDLAFPTRLTRQQNSELFPEQVAFATGHRLGISDNEAIEAMIPLNHRLAGCGLLRLVMYSQI